MPVPTYTVPTANSATATEEPKIITALQEIKNLLNGGLNETNISAAAEIPDSVLASANNSAYRTIFNGSTMIDDQTGSSGGVKLPFTSTYITSGTLTAQPPTCFYLAASEYAVAGMTTRLRVRGTLMVNSFAPVSTYTIGLYPLSAAAGANDQSQYTAGTVVSGSTAVIAAPPATTTTTAVSSEFSFPANGLYALGFTVTGGVGPSSGAMLVYSAMLQVRNT